jgi:organic radical activating enzyme
MSFADDSAPYEYSDTPELVDVKITGWCPHSKSCPWCYQDSDLDGKHAPLSLVKEAAAALGKMKAFEVALGGGEATMHPDFKEILKIFRDVGIIPNFTTFGMKWADDPATFEAVYNYAGGFALSVSEDSNTWRDRLDEVVGFIDSAGEVKNGEASDAIWSRYESRNRFMVQVILGVNSDDFIEEVFAAMKDRHMYSCTLLGYKSFGRGMKMAPKHSNSLARIINAAKANYIRLGVDTQVVNDYAVDLEAANIDSLLWTKAEGKFSCYLDLIGKKVARDSYTVGGLSFEPGGIFETVKKSFPF